MTDSRLRELERRSQETGDVYDVAAYLRERLRIGAISPDRLMLAAQLGHRPARLVVDWPFLESDHITGICPCPDCCLDILDFGTQHGTSTKLAKWLGAVFADVDPLTQLRPALIAARLALPLWEDQDAKRRGVSLEAHGRDGDVRSAPVHILTTEAMRKLGLNVYPRLAIEAAGAFLDFPDDPHLHEWKKLTREILYQPDFVPAPLDHPRTVCVPPAAQLVGRDKVITAIQRDLVAWALG